MAARTDVYASVTERIIEKLDQGVVAWKRPWQAQGLPVNVLTSKPYRGINILLLTLENRGDPRWGTYKALREAAIRQARREGREIVIEQKWSRGKMRDIAYEIIRRFKGDEGEKSYFQGGVRKGEKGTHVILWKPVKTHHENEDGEDEEGIYMLLRTYVVFNAQQADGIPPLVEEPREFTPIESAQKIVDGYVRDPGPPVYYGASGAWYNLTKDIVELPNPEDFFEDEEFYGTLFHELVHSTGHESRLKRIEPALFGTDPYAREELVAEIGASFLSGIAGLSIAGGEQSAAYIANWKERITHDPKLIVVAAAQAQKAADMILGTTFAEQEQEQEQEVAA